MRRTSPVKNLASLDPTSASKQLLRLSEEMRELADSVEAAASTLEQSGVAPLIHKFAGSYVGQVPPMNLVAICHALRVRAGVMYLAAGKIARLNDPGAEQRLRSAANQTSNQEATKDSSITEMDEPARVKRTTGFSSAVP